MSPRQQVFMELLQTESNYVGILHTIVNVRLILLIIIFFSTSLLASVNKHVLVSDV